MKLTPDFYNFAAMSQAYCRDADWLAAVLTDQDEI